MLMNPAEAVALSAQRVAARGRLVAGLREGRTRLVRLHQDGAAKIRMPAVAGGPLEAILINTAGGLTGGDRLAWQIEAEAGASITVTTQACEKLYRAGSGRAELTATLTAGEGARIAWLPQETIVFNNSVFARRLDVDLADGAEALILEATVFGRLAMGESVDRASFHDRWRIARNGRLFHAEDFALGPEVRAALAGNAVTGGSIAMATVLLVAADAEALLPDVRRIIGRDGGASAWTVAGTGKLLARLVAEDSYLLRQRLAPLVGLLNGQAGLPKVWSI